MNDYDQFKDIYNDKFDGSYDDLIEEHHRVLNEPKNTLSCLNKPIKNIKEIAEEKRIDKEK